MKYDKRKLDKLLKEITKLDLEYEQTDSKKHKASLRRKREKLLKEVIHERSKYYNIKQ